MTTCPKCKRSYADQDFRVCPVDGSVLSQEELPDTDPLINKVLAGRFRIVERIGQGGMGSVYKALHTEMDRMCAIKVLAPQAGDHKLASARFRREAKMSSRIDSPNAVTIYDFGEAEPGQFYLAMEFIEGESLAQTLTRQKSLPVERVLDIVKQIARALSAAHALGIVHRDLKPANIMLTRRKGSELVKVLDFGIAKTVTDDDNDNLTQTGYLLGTPTYMSPEQVLGESIDSRSDIYSFAIIVYQLLSGSLPFEGETLRTLIMNRVNGSPKSLRACAPFVSEEIAQVVMQALERDPARRPNDVDQFVAALSAATTGSKQLNATAVISTHTEEKNGPDFLPQYPSHSTTLDHDLHSSSAPTRSDSGTIAAVWQQPISQQHVPVVKKRSGLLLLLIPVALLILLVTASVVAYFIFFRSRTTPETTTLNQQPQSSSSAQPGPQKQTADNHYEAGKRYQQEAYSLKDSDEFTTRNNSAVAEYRQALQLRSNFPQAHENLGVALYDLGRVSEAIAEYEVAIKQYEKPTAQVYTNYGMALIKEKRYTEAAAAFSDALISKPLDSDLHYYRGFALYYAGEREESRAAFRTYLEQAPRGPHAEDVRNILDNRAVPTMSRP